MNRSIWSLLKRIRQPDDPTSDEVVLVRFVQQRDETAFELLVWRHGGFVLSVCKRMLRDEHAAEDAFQATFLILAKKAGTVRGSLAGWLHQVARRVCMRAKQRTKIPVVINGERMAIESPNPIFSEELRAVLDEEIARLPEKLRLVVVLCYLQNRTTEDAATLLDIPRGTVLSRLSRAREILSTRLHRRGIVTPATLLTTSLCLPQLSADICRDVTTNAIEFKFGSIATTLSTQLAHEVLHMAARKTAIGLAAIMVLTAGIGTGVGIVMAQGGGNTPASQSTKPSALAKELKQLKAEAKPLQEIQKEQRQERLLQLQKSAYELMDRIHEAEKKKVFVTTQSATDVDSKALQQRLEQFDQEILNMEDLILQKPIHI